MGRLGKRAKVCFKGTCTRRKSATCKAANQESSKGKGNKVSPERPISLQCGQKFRRARTKVKIEEIPV